MAPVQECGTSKQASASNSNRETERIVEFARAALMGLLANRNHAADVMARIAVDHAVALNIELKNRGL